MQANLHGTRIGASCLGGTLRTRAATDVSSSGSARARLKELLKRLAALFHGQGKLDLDEAFVRMQILRARK